ncbi:MAG: YihY/virulence factor BrkB family protein [Verrucomicrobiota bacterium]
MLSLFWRSFQKYNQTDGGLMAASFAYYAFFALFPLAVLLITLGAAFLGDGNGGGESSAKFAQTVIAQVKEYLPDVPEVRGEVVRSLEAIWMGRQKAGWLSFVVLTWSALQFFQSLVQAVNRAWGTLEFAWWRVPAKSLLMVGIVGSALFFGVLLPAVWDQAIEFLRRNIPEQGWSVQVMGDFFRLLRLGAPGAVLFYGLSMFYKIAPQRRTILREVWGAALFVTLSLNVLQFGFSVYARAVVRGSSVYGVFGGVMLLLLWIYLSGVLVIFGGCLCAAGVEKPSATDIPGGR